MTTESRFVAIPFQATPARAAVVSHILRSLCSFETIFSDYNAACESRCFECPRCLHCMAYASRVLSNPMSLVFEVWHGEDEMPCGVILLANIVPGVEVHTHFAFFDGQLRNKEPMMRALMEWVFEEHPGWLPPRRLTTEVPDYAFALARFASTRMGFGGDFSYEKDGKRVPVEGVRRKALRWRGVDRDVLLMGYVKPSQEEAA